MKDKAFIDTNIIIYAHTDIDIKKQKIAQKTISGNYTIISTQVLKEAANTLSKKFSHSWKDIIKVLTEATSNNLLYSNTQKTILNACNIAERYHYSFYDSLIIAAALEVSVGILYSEDLQDGQIIHDSLKITNPFR
ncbi:MAG: PIN domain-containing protein [Bacteroidales bacterium]|nr:PIN domain-containing protein [Bacteroidales bacterium]MCF8339135.1 PIN domain-containing protein [Bacteroidales bacterium]